MSNMMQGNVSQGFMYGPQNYACGGQSFQPGAQTGVGNLAGNAQNLVGNAGNLFGNVENLASNPIVQPCFDQNSQSRGFGAQIGGMTPQTQAVHQVLQLSQGLNNQQLLTLMQGWHKMSGDLGMVRWKMESILSTCSSMLG